ncbi:transcriptional regulator family: Fungal Specific TF [Paecilomyces variotii]|uniref:Fungal-specific transcription factor domain-containing protein n=1 Tax=Byssochlamys spectabilis TaxID=264951 RepID=A0A443HQ25_BYSSP|nr:fungal-specific transcription factor domain-containing protein [Paecilomyces variotii]KAJ9212592.1 transcriptional regulator family: Fungal Specific TF [Paecilomyces variotii]KAJ9230106.1 transcriptional regulator family: Fungal Specific TF [Paecilomyces variotii]KAJ9304856.1 transcriptional regulator family: Fungal Specific TF [Paecilomyces variotii]KAJ9362835.1 transcriptional regulator family: Fungal Specific TF [Paecilomyces variotii]RWQ93948.1 fungal-specific transcription factor domai
MAPTAPAAASNSPAKKATSAPEKKYKCQFCNRAFSRSEHRSRHERSHTKERPFKCLKCRSTFVRRDLLLRHDRTVHAKDGGIPLVTEGRRRGGGVQKTSPASGSSKPSITIDPATLEQIEASSDGMVDLETAAMLMTDFQHKAAAAATGQVNDRAGSNRSYSPERGPLLEPSVGYLSGNATLPQMPWDTLISPSETKHHPMTNSFASQESAAHGHQLPSMMERDGPVGDVLAPSLHSFVHSLPMSGNSTPNALSPYPSMTGPVSPVNYRRSPGPSQALTLPKAPQIANDMERNIIIERVKSADALSTLPDTFQLPSTASLNRYLSTYFNLYHHHLPFLHQESFKPTTVSSPLLLAVLSIGALYTFEREHAFMLHVGSKVLVNQFLQHKENFDSRKCPLWAMQSTLLNMVFESWSGDPKGLEWTCSIKSLLANMVAGNRYQLKLRTEARGGVAPSREEWIEDESCRRTYYAVYIFFGMLTLTFNHTPAMSFDEFDSLELPSSESLWNLEVTDEETWRRSLASSTVVTVRQAHDSLFQGEQTRYSAFATRVMINALFLQVWSHKRSFEALQDVVTEYKLRLALETWESSLEVCEPETIVVPLSTPQKGHPLIFNSMAVYRNTRARLEVDLKSIQEALRYHSSYEVAAAMTVAREKVKRSQEMNKVIQQCFECIEIAAIQGINWVAKTSATNWSVEHPLCGLDLMVILSLWLYRLEHDEEPATEAELAIYNKVRNLFDDDSVDAFGKLSSTVARVWGNILDGVVVWGITKLMGESFKLHAQALVGYEDSLVAAKDQPLQPMPTKGLASVGTAY